MVRRRRGLLSITGLLSLFGYLVLQGETYERFTLQEGGSLQARIIEVADDQVVLERTDGVPFTFPVSDLTVPGQERIRDWHIAALVDAGRLLSIEGHTSISDLKTSSEDGLRVSTWQQRYVLSLHNLSPYAINGLTVSTRCNLQRVSAAEMNNDLQRSPPTQLSETFKVDLPASQQPVSLKTPAITLKAMALEPGWTWPGGGNAQMSDRLSPMEVTVSLGQRVILQQSISPEPSLPKKDPKARLPTPVNSMP